MTNKNFLYKHIPPRTSFEQDMTEEEKNLMQQHATYFKGLMDKGIILVFGPVQDPGGIWGLAIVEVENEADAHILGTNDPTVKAGLNTFEIYPMRIGMMRSSER